mgnify:CR=1 FL=1
MLFDPNPREKTYLDVKRSWRSLTRAYTSMKD